MKQEIATPFGCRIRPGDHARCAARGAKVRALRIPGKSLAAKVHRFEMYAPERPESDVTVVCAHAVAIARSLPSPLGPRVLRLPFQLFPAQFLQIFRTF